MRRPSISDYVPKEGNLLDCYITYTRELEKYCDYIEANSHNKERTNYLTDYERDYLTVLVEPFVPLNRDGIITITKRLSDINHKPAFGQIYIFDCNGKLLTESINFNIDRLFTYMEFDKEYSLEDLGLCVIK